jgi:hypothetical protein
MRQFSQLTSDKTVLLKAALEGLVPITPISVQRWLDRLGLRFREIAMTRLSEITAFPAKTRNVSGSQSC